MAPGCLCCAAQHQPGGQAGAGLHPLRADGDTARPLLCGAGLPVGKQQPGAGQPQGAQQHCHAGQRMGPQADRR